MGSPGGRIDDALLLAGALALIVALTFLLYFADPLVRHDVDQLWRAIPSLSWPGGD